MLIGLGFTFFSGAVEAWLVDALHHAGYDGQLETVFGRGQIVGRHAMLVGLGVGGVVAQATDPRRAVPHARRGARRDVLRRGALMRDLGFEPERGTGPLARCARCSARRVEHGLRNPPVRWVMLAAPFTAGVGIYAFYALQPYLLELYGDAKAYTMAGLAAAIVAGVADRRRPARAAHPRGCSAGARRRIARCGASVSAALLVALGLTTSFWVALVAARRVGHGRRGDDADPPGVPQRHDPVEAARDGAVVRFAHGQRGRRGDPAGARPRRGPHGYALVARSSAA